MSAIQKYIESMQSEIQLSGMQPRVVVVGFHDYEALRAELMTLFSVNLDAKAAYSNTMEFGGVVVYRSSAHQTGFYFGQAIFHFDNVLHTDNP